MATTATGASEMTGETAIDTEMAAETAIETGSEEIEAEIKVAKRKILMGMRE